MTDVDITQCTPDVPDPQAVVNKAIATARGKVADLDFRPVDFNMDVSKFFSFEMIGRILGKPDGLGYDMCAICDSGDIDGAIANSPFPNGAQDTIDGINGSLDGINSSIDGINSSIDGLQDQVNAIGDSA